ncbi:MAG: spore maturation protein [Deltaproteobacteria bacterium RBG_13_49_15]|nr:MAG: spore maturation protein [Deltaproteobacteria bacterium RBG_13_49_15]
MNAVFLIIVVIAFGFGAFYQIQGTLAPGNISYMEFLSKGIVESASGAVELAIGLVGVMTLFLGLMKVAEAGGMLTILARFIRPLMVRLFPDVPSEHPAMGAMILNLSANVLGLGNAATPFGIRAMQELDKLNTKPGTATNAMVLFLAINTSSVTLLPTGVIALRASAGSADPAGILPTTLFATAGSTLIAILSAKIYARFFRLEPSSPVIEKEKAPSDDAVASEASIGAYPLWVSAVGLFSILAFIPLSVLYGKVISHWIIPFLMAGFLVFGFIRKVRIYEIFVEGAKEGFQVALRIIPYLVAILVAVGMFRASGAMNALVGWLGPLTEKVGLPAQALPMALMRPLSGSGAYAILASTIQDPTIGPDSYTGYLVSTLQGCTETTFYILAVYFGAVQIKRIRHTLAAGLTADAAGVIFSIIACSWLFR